MTAALAFIPDPTLRTRLLAHSHRDQSGCLLWTGETNQGGYGLIKNGPRRERRMISTHRAAFAVHVRPLLDGEHVLHHCDTPPCIEPTHLFAGDHTVNMHDMMAKGRRLVVVTPVQVGASNSQTHLTESDVLAIRSRRATGEFLKDLAEAFSVSQATVSEICSRRTWTHLP